MHSATLLAPRCRGLLAIVIASLLLGLCSEQLAAAETARIESLVDILLKQGAVDSANAVIKRALITDSVNTSLLMSLADVQKARRQPKARRATLDRILTIQKRSVDARLALVEDFFAAKQLDSAAYFANTALSASSRRSAGAYYWLGRIHQQAGHPDSAYVYYKRAQTLLPIGNLF